MSCEDSSYAVEEGEGTKTTYLNPRTLKHAAATVNQDISMLFEVYGRTCFVVGENNGRRKL